MYLVDSATDACNFDPNNMSESVAPEIVLHSNTIINNNNNMEEEEEISNFHHNNNNNNNATMEMEQQLQNEMGFANNIMNPFETHQGITNWDNNNNNMNEMQQQLPTPDLLSLFHLPTSVQLPHSSISFTNPNPKTSPGGGGGCYTFGYDAMPETLTGGGSSSVMYDPTMFHLNQLPPQPQPPLFRELLQSLPHGYNLGGGPRNGSSLFGNNDEGETDGSSRQLFENGVMEFSKEMKPFGRGRGGNKATKHFATERQRRVQLNEKFQDLKNLVPNPTKPDRASIVGDAIGYIEELKRTVEELKLLVEKKRCQRERNKRHKTEHDTGDDESCNMKPIVDPHEQSYNNGSLRSSWLQRKSKDTEVDVRIIDDEVTIKLVQRKKINLLLSVSKLLDELQLELHHAAGGHIGNSYSFLFNTKMYEGSSLYASAIANKLIEALDRQYAAIPPTSSY